MGQPKALSVSEHIGTAPFSLLTWRGRGLSKSFISRVIIGVTPFRVFITLLITYLLSPLPLQVNSDFHAKPQIRAKASADGPRL